MNIISTLYGSRPDLGMGPTSAKRVFALSNNRGFTLVELIAAVAIAATLTAIAIPNITRSIENARVAAAIGDIITLQTEIAGFEELNERFPATLAEIGRDGLLDPWGFPYTYTNFEEVTGTDNQRRWTSVARKDRFLVPLNTYYDLYSQGFDGSTNLSLQTRSSQDDVIRAGDGDYVGKGSLF